nr:LysR family transcriptional regulator [Granulicella paludicola]
MYDWAEFRHFRYLLMILEKKGLRAAADELHTTQPNLTVQARQFQENAEVRLFRRTSGNHIRVTDTGVAFAVIAKHLLEARDEAIDAIRSISRGEITAIRCGCSSLVDPNLFRALCSLHQELLPSAPVQPTHGDVPQFAEEICTGQVDVALITLPLKHPDLHIEVIRRERLVVCCRMDSPLAARSALHVSDLQDHLRVFYSPHRHPDAHKRLIEMLGSAGVEVREYSRASHPSEMQALVREGFGVALVREGTVLEGQLTTRPIMGVDWTLDTALIYHKQRHPKTVPVLARKFKRQFGEGLLKMSQNALSNASLTAPSHKSRQPQPEDEKPVQLRLLN